QEAHGGEDRAGAAEGIAQGEPVGEVELAQHGEVALARGRVAVGHRRQGAKCRVKALLHGQRGIPRPSAVSAPAPRGVVSTTASTGSAALPSRYASTRSSAAYTYGSIGT